MMRKYSIRFCLAILLIWTCGGGVSLGALWSHPSGAEPLEAPSARLADNPNPPSSPVKLIFIHHSTGGNWLANPNPEQPYGRLAYWLMQNNYYVSATNYGWGPHGIGDRTDIPNWPEWFTGPDSPAIMSALYAESGRNFGGFGNWPRLPGDPGGENQIILFKSCFPNSDLYGNPDDPPAPAPNEQYTVGNAKAVYNNILTYFATRQDKLFIAITAPPLGQGEYHGEDPPPAARAANARAFNNWLVNDWLDGYPHNNVAVFDYYNVLTSNGSTTRMDDPGTHQEPSDSGWADGNHHRWWDGAVQHIQTVDNNYSAYPTDTNWDSHPAIAGQLKATDEFVPLLNVFYNRWVGSIVQPTPTNTGVPPTSTRTATNTPTSTRTPISTPTATWTVLPTASATRPTGQYTVVFQQGVSPDASYAGAADVILARDGEPNANLGGLDYVELFFGDGEEQRRTLLHWDVSALPAGITVNIARVELYRFEANPENAMRVGLCRVTRSWMEGTGYDFWPDPSYVPDGATWTQSGPGTAWTTPGGDFNPAPVSQTTLAAGLGNGWIYLDATSAVRSWVEGGTPNHGLLLRPESGDYTYHYFYSREHGVADRRPRLVVNYTIGGATATDTPTATSTRRATPSRTVTPGTGHLIFMPVILKNWTVLHPTPTETAVPNVPIPAGLIQPSDLVYEGAFRLPDGPTEIGWEWNLTSSSMTYYPDGDPHGPGDGYPGSIFGTGHDFNQHVSEISIPVPVNPASKNLDRLNYASTLQSFQDIRAGMFQGLELPRVGLEYLPAQGAQTTGKLHFCWAPHMGEGDTNPSHGWCELNLSNPRTAGAWRIGDYWNFVTSDYIFAIPPAWAAAHTPGMYLATGRYRDGGQGAQGPSVLAYGPWNHGNPPPAGATLQTVPLLLYGSVYTPGSARMDNYHHSDEWSGAAWLTAGDRAAVAFVGTKGTGDCWYGCADGTVWPDEPPYPPECPERGWWSTGFVGQIILYDPSDLAAVAHGRMESGEPQPYATLNIDQHLYHVTSSQQKEHVGAASFDRRRGLLYVFEPLADDEKALIHVWRIRQGPRDGDLGS